MTTIKRYIALFACIIATSGCFAHDTLGDQYSQYLNRAQQTSLAQAAQEKLSQAAFAWTITKYVGIAAIMAVTITLAGIYINKALTDYDHRINNVDRFANPNQNPPATAEEINKHQ